MYENETKELATLLESRDYGILRGSSFRVGEHNHHGFLHYDLLLADDSSNKWDRAACIIFEELMSKDNVWDLNTPPRVEVTLCQDILMRGVTAKDEDGKKGPWWFDAALLGRWERALAGHSVDAFRQKFTEVMRAQLAIPEHWGNELTSVIKMTPCVGIPVLKLKGKPKSKDSNLPFPKEKVVLIGGYQQVFVPFVPFGLVDTVW